ncbi:MAG: hypothetical protein VYE22_21000 [Myxococcota bacterium]|nr:hypothetical protein [Myxococcota bacterium]
MRSLEDASSPAELLELSRHYDAPLRLPMPAAHADEATLPGAIEAWQRGLEEGRRHVLDVLWSPGIRGAHAGARVQHVLDRMAVRAASRRAGEEARELQRLFRASPRLGRRLELLARAEVAARFAGHLAAIGAPPR